jgi:hypothetical protein
LHTGRFVALWPEARAQLDKCRVVDNTPLFDAMDKMAAEVPAEEWAKVPQVDGSAPLEQYDGVCKAGEYEPSSLGDVGQGDASEFVAPYQPWRRGPLAVWTLVNISCHDGRLTVVMKRGRGELIIETGPDDEALWERLTAKVVDVNKAKAKAAAEAKEKSDG